MKIAVALFALLTGTPRTSFVQAQTAESLTELWGFEDAQLTAETDNGVLTVSFEHGSAGLP